MSKAMDTLILRFAIDHVYYIYMQLPGQRLPYKLRVRKCSEDLSNYYITCF